jgi:hypothetical protein
MEFNDKGASENCDNEDCNTIDFESAIDLDNYEYRSDSESSTFSIDENAVLANAVAQILVEDAFDRKTAGMKEMCHATAPVPSINHDMNHVDRKPDPDQINQKCASGALHRLHCEDYTLGWSGDDGDEGKQTFPQIGFVESNRPCPSIF